MKRSKRFIGLLCCVAMILSTLLCSCTHSESKDTGSYTTDKKLCWIKHDTHYENNKSVNIAELYVTSFNGSSYDSTVYSLNEVFDPDREGWKILQNLSLEDDRTLYIANYGGRQVDIVSFTLSEGFSDKAEHYALPSETYDGIALNEIGEIFAVTNEFVFFTAIKTVDSCREVSVCRYSIADNSNEILTSYTISKSYYSTPALSRSGDILFIAESLNPSAEGLNIDSFGASKTYLYKLSEGEAEYIDEARLAVWSDDGSKIIYQPIDTQYMMYDIAKKESSVYVSKTQGRNSRCDSFAVSDNDIAYWAAQSDLYIRDGIFTWKQMVPDGVKLVLLNRETGEEMIIIGCDTFKQFDFVDCSSLVWLEQ